MTNSKSKSKSKSDQLSEYDPEAEEELTKEDIEEIAKSAFGMTGSKME